MPRVAGGASSQQPPPLPGPVWLCWRHRVCSPRASAPEQSWGSEGPGEQRQSYGDSHCPLPKATLPRWGGPRGFGLGDRGWQCRSRAASAGTWWLFGPGPHLGVAAPQGGRTAEPWSILIWELHKKSGFPPLWPPGQPEGRPPLHRQPGAFPRSSPPAGGRFGCPFPSPGLGAALPGFPQHSPGPAAADRTRPGGQEVRAGIHWEMSLLGLSQGRTARSRGSSPDPPRDGRRVREAQSRGDGGR